LTDERDRLEQESDHPVGDNTGKVRRPYVAPELVEYGTVAKLTQSGGTSLVMDFGNMMRTSTCL
jgi:hypothetical protein